ncbi:hypothetical protein CSKR_108650 [Clonorchis sinensis]|uniref:Uncharacterized protein n=1 Tax=Clonorchis sinensis TaxID=79923 RepID=A0A419PPC0_CLOSI|nr:hypothetical protein CSKR_108650 [Clonorchis sinensis]
MRCPFTRGLLKVIVRENSPGRYLGLWHLYFSSLTHPSSQILLSLAVFGSLQRQPRGYGVRVSFRNCPKQMVLKSTISHESPGSLCLVVCQPSSEIEAIDLCYPFVLQKRYIFCQLHFH